MICLYSLFVFQLMVSVTLAATVDPTVSNSVATDKAVAFLWSQTRPDSYKWPEGEITSAILGLVSAKPPITGGRFLNSTEQLIVNVNLEEINSDFLKKSLKPDKKKQVGTLGNLDLSSLIQYIGVLQVNCRDPRNYFGHDLVQEAVTRLDDITNTAPTFGALIMTICNADAENSLKKQHFQSLAKSVPTTGNLCPFCVERSSMNILALACLVNKASAASDDAETHLPSVKSLRGLIGRFTKYLDSVQEKDGGFGSLFATSLAIQAKLSTKVKTEFDVDAAWKNLKSSQKPDGSFGSSITFTAFALPALTGQTLIDIRRIPCPDPELAKKSSPTLIVAYELEDLVFSQQKFRGHISVKKGTTLLEALTTYSKENPTIMKLETETVNIGTRIKSISGIKNDEGATTHWFVDAIYSDGKVVPISAQLKTTIAEDSDKVVYRMTYKTAKLSL
jgi:hypothetical protein